MEGNPNLPASIYPPRMMTSAATAAMNPAEAAAEAYRRASASASSASSAEGRHQQRWGQEWGPAQSQSQADLAVAAATNMMRLQHQPQPPLSLPMPLPPLPEAPPLEPQQLQLLGLELQQLRQVELEPNPFVGGAVLAAASLPPPEDAAEDGAAAANVDEVNVNASALILDDHTEAFSNLKDDLAELDFGEDDDDDVEAAAAAAPYRGDSGGGKPSSLLRGISGGGGDTYSAQTETDLTFSVCDGGSQTSSQLPEPTLVPSEHARLLAEVRSALDLVGTYRAAGKEEEGEEGGTEDDAAELHRALGRVLYEHFAGEAYLDDANNNGGGAGLASSGRDSGGTEIAPLDSRGGDGDVLEEDDGQASKRKGRRTAIDSTAKSNNNAEGSGYVPLLDLGYPIRLSTMVDCLVKAGSSATKDGACSFASAREVEEELREMLEQPGRYLYDAAACDGHLRFAEDRLYGRSDELATLMSAYDRVIHLKEEKRGIALINGYAGTGKTSLVDQILPRLESDRASLVHCKFDIHGQEQPMSSFFRALDGYCQTLVDGDPVLLAEIRDAINHALGPSVSLLKGQVPHLDKILGRDSPVLQRAETTDALSHISYSLRLFVRAISGPSHPLVFLLDDLQYADKNSADAINLLLKDADATSLLFIGCYREESLSIDHPLTESLGEIAMAAEMPMSSISLGNLDKESVNNMVSETLNMSRRLTRPLADALHTKTSGNPMFVRQLMASLNSDGLIRYSATVRRWKWNIEAIREKDVADSAVDLIIGRMKGYGREIELMLQVAACLGTSFDPTALCLCFTGKQRNEGSVHDCLMRLEADGLINKVGTVYRFGHDLIWQAAYALTPSSKQQSMHLHVGRQLVRNGNERERTKMGPTIADQLNRGIELITDNAERMLLAKINLQVGQKELSSMSFLPASIYLLQGSTLVRDEDWEDHYNMCLQLFTSCAEVQLALGNSSESISLATQVLSRARSLQDKLGAYHALIQAKTMQEDDDEPVQIGLSVLEQLGESFPTNINQALIGKELMETKHLLESSSVEKILNTEAMADADRVATMRFLLRVSRLFCCALECRMPDR